MTASIHIDSVAIAVPPYLLSQLEVRELCAHVFHDKPEMFERLSGAYLNAGIETRYSCVPLDWYADQHNWPERNQLYRENALELLQQASERALEQAGTAAAEIDAVITVSSTGIATPTLDALLVERIGLRPDVIRLPVFGLGCAGGVSGLARASDVASSGGGRKVLLLVVELCALTFRPQDITKSNIIASALFGDGAAALVIGPDGEDRAVLIGPSHEHLWPDSEDVMGWRVEDDGLAVIFSRDIPNLIRNDLGSVVEPFLSLHGTSLDQLDGLIFHPGGKKVIDAYRDVCDKPEPFFCHSLSVLRDYGNMSAVGVMAVLQRTLDANAHGRHLMAALGPGFTASFCLLDLK